MANGCMEVFSGNSVGMLQSMNKEHVVIRNLWIENQEVEYWGIVRFSGFLTKLQNTLLTFEEIIGTSTPPPDYPV
jgi:hypothetical protein